MKYRFALALILLAALSRLLPHWPNFTAVGAMGLFGAAVLRPAWLSFAVPFFALFLSDLILNNVVYAGYSEGFVWYTSVWIYGAFAGVVVLGRLLLAGRTPQMGRLALASVSASLLFFAVTNFSVWLESGMYPRTTAGLAACYLAGLPFLDNTLWGDLFFTALLFGAQYWFVWRQKAAIANV